MGKILSKVRQRKEPMVDRVERLEKQVYILQHAVLDLTRILQAIAEETAKGKQQQNENSIILTDKQKGEKVK